MSKWVYSFGAGHNEGRAEMKNLLGGKGANLAEMASIGLPGLSGFVSEFLILVGTFATHAWWGAIAATGVDFISVGAITHSARAVDIGLDFED